MAWSTRELAELAGTTVNAVRHYHRVGLLDEPERASNGYKQYEVRHLARLMLIRRLRELGVPLNKIAQASAAGSASAAALSAIDTELERSIERLQRAREEIGAIVRGSTVGDPPDDVGIGATRHPVVAHVGTREAVINSSYINHPDEDAAP